MPDERQDSIRQGISAPDESEIGQKAREARRRRDMKTRPLDGAMGGTSDSDSPAEEAQEQAARAEAREEDERDDGEASESR